MENNKIYTNNGTVLTNRFGQSTLLITREDKSEFTLSLDVFLQQIEEKQIVIVEDGADQLRFLIKS